MSDQDKGPLAKLRELADRNEGTARLMDAAQDYLSTKASNVVSGATSGIGNTVERLTGEGPVSDAVAGGAKGALQGDGVLKGAISSGAKGLKDKASKALGGGGGGSSSGGKATTIVEDLDVGVPLRVAYNQWTRFPDFGDFAKGVQNVEEEDETTTKWRAKILWSSRSWKGTVTEQIQDYRIAWTSEGSKGTTKGAVTFHPLGENLTRVLLVTEYYPQGFFEKTANLWRAQGRRLRLDFKLYRRRLMMLAQEEGEELEGWRGEIRDSEVVVSHEDAVAEEERDEEESEEYDENGDGDEAEEYDEGEGEEEGEDEAEEYDEEEEEGGDER
ncbi:SRPBCC family protein [Nocardiopsis sp. NPDC058631]|uniref:SRPBCC family protein n=1 Tax=Nocardiopsis sp. NPDC058631 TaxID=3346566 RepID=UPI00364EB8FE